MDILNIAKNIGIGIFSEVVPGGSNVLKVVNAMLPDNMKFIGNETGVQIAERIQSMPPELQQQLALKEFDVQIEQLKQSHDTLRTMLIQDAITPQTTRPKIANKAFNVVACVTLAYVMLLGYAVLLQDTKLVEAIIDGWVLVVGFNAPFIGWLNAYFGKLTKETESKLAIANGQDIHLDQDGSITKLLKLGRQK